MNLAALKRPSYFLVLSGIGLAAALIGFSKTFFVPMAAGTFSAPVIIHVHGALAFAWIILFMVQNSVIYLRQYSSHRTLGYVGFTVAIGLAVTMVPVGTLSVERELARGAGESGYSTLLGVLTSGLLFLAFVIGGIVSRRKPEHHKRFMLLATIIILWPAWFRFRHYFPSVPRPDIWFGLVLADSLIVISWIWEMIKFKKVHPVLLWGGAFIIVEQSFEVISVDTPVWRSVSKWLYLAMV